MRCAILAAGQGTRLRPVAPSKPLAPLLGAPLIERVIEAAVRGGATSFVVVTGYEAEPLEAFLRQLAEQRGLPITCSRNPDWRKANGLSVLAAAPHLRDRFLLLMADHLFDPEIVQLLCSEAKGREGLLLAVDRRLDNPLVDLDDVTRVATGPDNRIRAIGKGLTPYDAFDTGIFLAPLGLLDEIRADVSQGGEGSLTAGVRRLAARGETTAVDIGERYWLDVDDAVAFRHAERKQASAAALA